MSLAEWLAKRETEEKYDPVKEVQLNLQKEHSGSGMRNHLKLLQISDDSTECFCSLKKYGLDVFDPAKMPRSWRGCGNCV